jgi:2,3,4,5-tetrahydropyridine-2,6-dicarboxylate N-succinyltransferase
MSTQTDFDLNTRAGFDALTQSIKDRDDFVMPQAFALGVATMARADSGVTLKLIDVKFPWGVNFGTSEGTAAVLTHVLGPLSNGFTMLKRGDLHKMLECFTAFASDAPEMHPNIMALSQLLRVEPEDHHFADHYMTPVLVVVNDVDAPPEFASEVYLRLHLLSLCLTKPGTVNLDGAFGLLNNNAWTNYGVFDVEAMDHVRRVVATEYREPVVVTHQDKFPRLLDYVSPKGVRIVNQEIRLGAHLAPGTVVMSAGWINFDAGTLGPSMVEGRISGGVVVGANSDIGGGASILGTLSGGNKTKVSIGEGCLLEAMSTLGIPVGDRVRVAASHAVKSTSLVRLELSRKMWSGNPLMHDLSAEYRGGLFTGPHDERYGFVKAEYLAGVSDVIFRRNDVDGCSEVIPRGDTMWGSLNQMLHDN